MLLITLSQVLLACLCQGAPAESGPEPSPLRVQAERPTYVPAYEDGVLRDASLRGTWSLAGYGFLLELGERGLRIWSTCSAGCWDITETDFFTAEELLVDAAGSGDRRWITFDSLASPYAIERTEGLPDSCSDDSPWTPLRTFDAFAALMSDYYPFFEVRGIDWPARVRAARATIDEGASELALFTAMASTLEGLQDGHVGLSAEIDGKEHSAVTAMSVIDRRIARGLDPGLDAGGREDATQSALREVYRSARLGVERDLLDERGQSSRDHFVWGRIQEEVGYIRFNGMGFDEELPGAEQAAEVHAAFEEMLEGLEGVAALVLDCSFNGGGSDTFAHAIAEHFIDEVREPYTKAPASRPDLSQTITLRPWPGRRFTGPVFLVSSDLTASAAEIFQVCLKDEPHVTLIGTRGARIFSDVIPKTLPNGWSFQMSIEAYRDAEGVCYEGLGVPVDVEVPLFEGEDLATSHTRAMERVLDHVWASL